MCVRAVGQHPRPGQNAPEQLVLFFLAPVGAALSTADNSVKKGRVHHRVRKRSKQKSAHSKGFQAPQKM